MTNSMCSIGGNHLPMIGSAPLRLRQWFLEIAPPWPRQVLGAEHLSENLLIGCREAIRSQVPVCGFYGEETSREAGKIRLIDVWCDEKNQHHVRHYFIAREQPLDWFQKLIENPLMETAERLPLEGRDVFMCVHGERDECCGVFGEKAYQEAQRLCPDDVRLWRASHLGGHRFAPTWAEYPEALWWGRGGLEDALCRTGQPWEFLRGRSSLSARQQVVEQEMFKKRGWAWLDEAAHAQYSEEGDRVEMVAKSLQVVAVVVCQSEQARPSCGQDVKSVSSYTLKEWREIIELG